MSPTTLRDNILAAFCQAPTPTETEIAQYTGVVANDDREKLRAALAIRPEVRTWRDLSFHALNVVSAEGLQWLLPTYLFFALERPLTQTGDERLFFGDLLRFLEPWETDLDPKSALGQPWEWMAQDHLEWITKVMAELSPDQKQAIAEVALHISRQEPEPGPATRSLELRWKEFLPPGVN